MGLLNEGEIRDRLNREPSEIFLRPTWTERQLRGAGYDLRIDSRIRGLNAKEFPPDQDHGEELRLEPGDTASVLSFERFVMPWDLAANLGLRFRYAREGLSVVTGLLVDPGYGWREAEGELRPIGAPLHFFLTNIGSDPIRIRLGESGAGVLSVQFLQINPPEEHAEVTPPSDVAATQALWAFRNIEEIKARADRDRSMLETLKSEVTVTRRASEQIAIFGVFLVAATLFGVAIAILVEAIGQKPGLVKRINEIHFDGASAVIATIVGGVILLLGLVAMLLLVTRGFSWAIERKRLQQELEVLREEQG